MGISVKNRKTKIGKMNQRIGIYETTEVSNGQGSVIETESLVLETWASVEPYNAAREIENGQLRHFTGYRFTIRHRTNTPITVSYYIIYKSETYRIKGLINELEDDRFLTIEAFKKQ